MSLPLSFSFWISLIFSMNLRYSLSCAKLRLALYMICVFNVPSLAISRISAIMQSLSLRLLVVVSAVHEFNSISLFQIYFL